MKSNLRPTRFATKSGVLAVLCGSVLLAGCEQMKTPGYYEPAKASSTSDAIRQAETGGTREVVRAPSQIQFAVRRPGSEAEGNPATGTPPVAGERLSTQGQAAMAAADAEDKALSSLIPAPHTFFGTLPCFHRDMRCTVQQITLTVAPNGRWRARAAYLEQKSPSGKAMAAQGCWRIVPTSPPNLVLLDGDRNVRAELLFVSRNTLRLKTIDGEAPNLTYTLSRQPDLDPIAELDKSPPPNCN